MCVDKKTFFRAPYWMQMSWGCFDSCDTEHRFVSVQGDSCSPSFFLSFFLSETTRRTRRTNDGTCFYVSMATARAIVRLLWLLLIPFHSAHSASTNALTSINSIQYAKRRFSVSRRLLLWCNQV